MAKVAALIPGADAMLLKAAVGIPASAGVPGVTTVPAGEGSAMGYALLMRGPVLSTVDTETRFLPSEVVRKSGVRSSANVVIWAGDGPFGSLEADSPEPEVFDEDDVHFLQLYANLVGAAVERQRLSSRAENLARERELLLKESMHRVKNILSVVHAVAWRTHKDVGSLDEFIQTFNGRIAALSRLQDLTLGRSEHSVPLSELARAELEATGAREGEQYVLTGPEFRCSPNTAQALGLLFHELSTNACKYGALNPEAPAGSRIDLSWQVRPNSRGKELELHWSERGGVPRVSDHTSGFGSELLREGIARMLGGSTEFRIHEHGVDCITRFSQND
jgi:two-component sensor histidine kinase